MVMVLRCSFARVCHSLVSVLPSVIPAVFERVWNMYLPTNVATAIPEVLAFYPASNYDGGWVCDCTSVITCACRALSWCMPLAVRLPPVGPCIRHPHALLLLLRHPAISTRCHRCWRLRLAVRASACVPCILFYCVVHSSL